jgi:hypothetical protein
MRLRAPDAGLMMAGLKLGWTGMFAIAASGFVALALDHLLGPELRRRHAHPVPNAMV